MTCEECWRDASFQALVSGGSTAEIYARLVKERENDPEHVERNKPRCGWADCQGIAECKDCVDA